MSDYAKYKHLYTDSSSNYQPQEQQHEQVTAGGPSHHSDHYQPQEQQNGPSHQSDHYQQQTGINIYLCTAEYKELYL